MLALPRKAVAAASLAAVAAVAAAVAVAQQPAGAADSPGSLVEDFAYPGRDAILAEHNLKLISGDGNILFVDCDVAGDVIKIESYDFADYVCFQLRGAHGYLKLEIGRSTYVYSENKPLEATLQVEGETETETKQVQQNWWTAVGEAENRPSATLLELRA
ncbi:hypothetical protein [Paractinoplanes maris]|uniref:hypothetical protein n=1 Tax=Paractinoplanes maris TaxID=1734446 RepID=UPI0020204726|nr:hypothetical protein [Actinoplanes maris]